MWTEIKKAKTKRITFDFILQKCLLNNNNNNMRNEKACP